MSAWICPPTRQETIENLVSGVDRYNPSNVGILEDYLYHQIRSSEYDCLANLAILKLYQFNPDLYNADVVINILLKALAASPLPDFNLCMSLLDERPSPHSSQDEEEEEDQSAVILPILTSLHGLLLECKFPVFWKKYRSEEVKGLRDNYTVEFRGFEDAIREVVVRAVKATFTRIGKERFGGYLDLQGSELDSYISKLAWTVDGGVLTVPANPDNQIESTVVQEAIKLPQLAKVIAHSAKIAA